MFFVLPSCNPCDVSIHTARYVLTARSGAWNIQMAKRASEPLFEVPFVCQDARSQVSGGSRFSDSWSLSYLRDRLEYEKEQCGNTVKRPRDTDGASVWIIMIRARRRGEGVSCSRMWRLNGGLVVLINNCGRYWPWRHCHAVLTARWPRYNALCHDYNSCPKKIIMHSSSEKSQRAISTLLQAGKNLCTGQRVEFVSHGTFAFCHKR